MAIHFLHTADLQIGKAFGQFPSEVASKLRDARLGALKRIATHARDRHVDAVLIAGDCFDEIAVGDDTLRRFKIALEHFGGRWVLLPGNHDPAIAESPWSRLRRLPLPENVIIADMQRPIMIGGKAAVLPSPLCRRREATDLTEWFDTAATEEGLIRIGLAHGSVRELLPEASEAANPIALDRAKRARLDYLALGDWHGRLRVSERTWYSGTPEPDRFRLNEPGYVLEIVIERPGATPSVKEIPVADYRWLQKNIDLMPGGIDEIRRAIEGPDFEMERLVLRLGLQGTIDLATRAALDDALEDVRARVLHLEEDETGLTLEPTEDDFDSIDTAGFVRSAMNRLREHLDGEGAHVARRALELLYGLHHRDCS